MVRLMEKKNHPIISNKEQERFIGLSDWQKKVFSFLLLRAAKMAPVSAPLVIEFQGSSFPRRRTKPQSIVEKSPPQTAKLPAIQQTQARINQSRPLGLKS